MSQFASENTRRMIPVRWVLALLALVVIIGVGSGIYYFAFWRDSPRSALWQMVRAIQANDTQTLFQYIDLQAVADNLVEKSTGDVESLLLKKGFGATPEEDDVSKLVRGLTKKFARFLAPKVVAALEPQIKAGLERYLAELNTMEKAALAGLPAKAEIQQQDNVAAVTVTDPISGQAFHFRMARPTDDAKWRIVEINYQDLRAILERKFVD
jgi:hypothetical protein